MWEILSKANPPDPHICELPDYRYYHFQVNDVVRCKECGQKYVLRRGDELLYNTRFWAKLRWYHIVALTRLHGNGTLEP